MKKSILLAILLSPFLLVLAYAQNTSRPEDVKEMQGVFHLEPPQKAQNPFMAVGIKGAFFVDHKNLLTNIQPNSWVVAPRGEVGLFANFYANRFIFSTVEWMYARDEGYTSSGDLLGGNSISFNALINLRAPIIPRFALTAGIGVYSSIGALYTDYEIDVFYITGMLTELAAETSFGDRNQHVFTFGMRNKWRINQLRWADISYIPVGLVTSYAFRW